MQKMSIDIYPHVNQFVQDAYDTIITNFVTAREDPHIKSICVVGSSPGVGATTVALNLSVSLVMAGWKVAFIDSDMRKPRTAKRLDKVTLLGLSDYFTQQITLSDIICQTNIENLHYVACGNTESINPIGMLSSVRFSELLEQLIAVYDFILFDTPSLNSVGDALVVASRSDCTLLVAKAGKTRKTELAQSLSKLNATGASGISIVLNKMSKDTYKTHVNAYNYFSKAFWKKKNRKNNQTEDLSQ